MFSVLVPGFAAAGQTSPAAATRWQPSPPYFPPGTQTAVLDQSYTFVIEAEIPAHPYWPGGDSGITIGVGWDLGQHSREELLTSGAELGAENVKLFKAAVHKTGKEAQLLLPEVKGIDVPVKTSLAIFGASLANNYYPATMKLFSGAEKLPAGVQVALVFNRGTKPGNNPDWRKAKELDRRWEIRRRTT